MKLDSARALKEQLMIDVVVPLAAAASARVARSGARRAPSGRAIAGAEVEHTIAVAADPVHEVSPIQRSIALGIVPSSSVNKPDKYRLAVRVQRESLLDSSFVEKIQRDAKGEADVRFVGRIGKRGKRSKIRGGAAREDAAPRASAVPWYRGCARPLQIGVSIGHFDVTAGTLGAFVRASRGSGYHVLSNNHVLANEDDASAGDEIVQQGALDGGRRSRDTVGTLRTGWIRLKKRSPNLVDCALAEIRDGIDCDCVTMRDVNGSATTRLLGISPQGVLDEGITVHKVGRTTGATKGRVTAYELDNVVVSYGVGNLRFDKQIEIEGTSNRPFSDGGDSGSLIVDSEFRALALLFAGSEIGGANGRGLTYANPIETVLSNLKVDLVY
jgi:hypothetical protein